MYLIDLHTSESTQFVWKKKKKENCVKQPAHPHWNYIFNEKKSHATKNKKEYENSIIATKKTTHKVREKNGNQR